MKKAGQRMKVAENGVTRIRCFKYHIIKLHTLCKSANVLLNFLVAMKGET